MWCKFPALSNALNFIPIMLTLFLMSNCGKHEQTSRSYSGMASVVRVEQDGSLLGLAEKAIREENIEVLNDLLLKGLNPDSDLKTQHNLMTEASAWNKMKIISLLLKFNADPFKKDLTGNSASDYAENNIILKRLLNPHLEFDLRKRIIRFSIDKDLNELKVILEDEVPDLNFKLARFEIGDIVDEFEFGETLLTWLIRSNNENVFRLFLNPKYSIDINCKNVLNETPLAVAKKFKRTRMVNTLTKLGAYE